jgi:Dolichyl-phosphate-mannose-protein mannosyltransferase
VFAEGDMTTARHLLSCSEFLIFSTALVIRLALIIAFPDAIPVANMEDKLVRYDPIAMNLLGGRGFVLNDEPTAISGPLFPLFLSVIYALFGYSQNLARIFLSFIDAAHPVVFYLIAKRHFNGLVPILTASVVIVHPFFIYEVFSMSSEPLFFLIHALFMLSFSGALLNRDPRGFLLGGALLGLATLCRAVSLLLPVFVAPIFFVAYRAKLKTGLFHLALFLFGFTVVLTPWVVRNYVVFQRFIPVQELGGVHLYWASPLRENEKRKDDRAPVLGRDTVQRDRSYYTMALERIKEDPIAYVQLMGQRLVSMWYKTSSRRYEGVALVTNGVLLVLALPGVILSWRRWRTVSYLLIVVGYYIAVHTFMVAILRYILPVVPILTMFAMVTIDRLLGIRGRVSEFGRASGQSAGFR